MMNFENSNLPSQKILLHYARKLDNGLAVKIVSGNANLSSSKEAESLAYFFWEATDHAVEDQNNDVVIEGINDFESCLEKALHIFRGYFKKLGYGKEWSAGYDQYHNEE